MCVWYSILFGSCTNFKNYTVFLFFSEMITPIDDKMWFSRSLSLSVFSLPLVHTKHITTLTHDIIEIVCIFFKFFMFFHFWCRLLSLCSFFHMAMPAWSHRGTAHSHCTECSNDNIRYSGIHCQDATVATATAAASAEAFLKYLFIIL